MPFILPERTWDGKRTLRTGIFELVVTASPQSERMRKPSENISGDRSKEDRHLDQLSMF